MIDGESSDDDSVDPTRVGWRENNLTGRWDREPPREQNVKLNVTGPVI